MIDLMLTLSVIICIDILAILLSVLYIWDLEDKQIRKI